MSAAGGSGTRARSRQLGAAEAYRDISHLLGAEARKWKGSADQQLSPEFHAALTVAAREMQRLADYAHGVSMLYEIPGMDELTGFAWNPRFNDPAPAELPQREHPESN